MQPSPDMLLQTLVDSGILSEQDATQLSQSSQGSFDASDSTHVEQTGELLDRLRQMGSLSDFQMEKLEQDGPDSLVLGDYILMDRLGSGGMGEVFRAMHRVMRREVAIKRIKTAAVQSPGLTERFLREVRTAAKLSHPNIVTAYDAGEDDTGCYLVMEYVEGKDLAELIKQEGPLSVEQAADYLLQAARALSHAHEAGIIHRDVKPANFLVSSSGSLKLLDLGLARVEQQIAEYEQSAHLTMTQPEQMMGTLGYMAPEQAEDAHNASAAADLYSLGCTLCQMVTGRPPFTVKTAMQALIAHREKPPPDLSSHLPPALNSLYLSLVAKAPEDRPASTAEVVRVLEQILASEDISLASVPSSLHAFSLSKAANRDRSFAKPLLVAGSLALVVMAAVGGILLLQDPGSETPSSAEEDAPPEGDVPQASLTLSSREAAATIRKEQLDQYGVAATVSNSLEMSFGFVPSGTCWIGSTDEQVNWALAQVAGTSVADRYAQYITSESPRTIARVHKPFYMGATEVTVGQFRAFVNATNYETVAEREGTGYSYGTREQGPAFGWENPGMPQTESHPVVNLTQADCLAFCEWLSELEGRVYRLPTATEWEYACRAGSQGLWSFGDEPALFYDYGWGSRNAQGATAAVRQLLPNTFGLYDMHGNVREWVMLDHGQAATETGIGMVCGGSFTKSPVLLRSASRVGFNTNAPYPYHGFRVLLEFDPEEASLGAQ